eukprot:5044701-Pleurochrysis_carterae.AAC.1
MLHHTEQRDLRVGEFLVGPQVAQETVVQLGAAAEADPLRLHGALRKRVGGYRVQVEVADKAGHRVEQPLHVQDNQLARARRPKPEDDAERMEVREHGLKLHFERKPIVRQTALLGDRPHL